ncbi:MAG: copper amine oxidase N-terminal domain-containing protein [Clostridiales bacterium]|jgi:hypothetical protein|nr:copper amine oxidase N-terminal domain-containing protein [Clostridiales bacterium]
MTKNKLKAIIFAFVVFLQRAPVSAAEFNPAAVRIDLSSGLIRGETCDFTITLPPDLREYIRAYHQVLPADSRMMEKIEFYFFPIDKSAKPALLLSVNVFDRRFFSDNNRWQLLYETERYMFTVYTTRKAPVFAYAADRILYSYYDEKLSDINFLRGAMTFPEEEKIIENSVFIGGELLAGQVMYLKKNVPCVPLRMCAERLGFAVDWDGGAKIITLSKDGVKYQIFAWESPSRGYNAKIAEGKAFVSAFFFMDALGMGVEIDERHNVYITP